MPYMLIKAGLLSPYCSIQGNKLASSSASPPKITYRKLWSEGSVLASTNGVNWRKAEGVWFSTVTRSRRSSSANASGERLTQYGTTTTFPPNSSAPQTSQTEKSKAQE